MQTTDTLTLADFLLARIAEDERATMTAVAESCGLTNPPLPDQVWIVERTLAGRQASARAASRLFAVELWSTFPWRWAGDAWLKKMALPYATHPDYQQEWSA